MSGAYPKAFDTRLWNSWHNEALTRWLTTGELTWISEAYRRYAGQYDVFFGSVFQPGRKAIVDGLECGPGERILEVGVGTGLSLPLYPGNVTVTGIDISSDMLRQAQARKERAGLNNARLAVMDAEDMEFEDNSFDKVVAMYVDFVVPDPERLVDEMRRVCKRNGRIVFVNHFHSRNPIFGTRMGAMERHDTIAR